MMPDAPAKQHKYVKGTQEHSLGVRACCMLCDFKGGLLANFLEDAPATYRHVYDGGSGTPLRSLFPMDPVGIMYTCAGGFIDFASARHR